MLIPFSLILITISFAIAGIHDWRKRFIPVIVWIPAVVGAIMYGIETADFTTYIYKLVFMIPASLVLLWLGKNKKFSTGDVIALFFASFGTWIFFPLMPLILSLLPLFAYIRIKKDRTRIPFVSMLGTGHIATIIILAWWNMDQNIFLQ